MIDLKTWFRESLSKYLTVIKTEIAGVRQAIGDLVATDQEFSTGEATDKVPSVKQVKSMAPKRQEFHQTVAEDVWTVNHNFGVRPHVQVFSIGGVEMLAEVIHTSDNQIQVIFDGPVKGYVICM